MRRDEVATRAAIDRALRELGWEDACVEMADSFGVRLLGMTARSPVLPDGCPRVLAFPRCRSVHTCCMRYPLDIAFADAEGSVLAFHRGVAPWRFLFHPHASFVVERASLTPSAPLCFA